MLLQNIGTQWTIFYQRKNCLQNTTITKQNYGNYFAAKSNNKEDAIYDRKCDMNFVSIMRIVLKIMQQKQHAFWIEISINVVLKFSNETATIGGFCVENTVSHFKSTHKTFVATRTFIVNTNTIAL